MKGVPLLYLPVLYYPTKEDDRATGFLIPTYGASTLRGQSIHNAFFWAIDRSQDATFLYDWFSKTGQGAGSDIATTAAAARTDRCRALLCSTSRRRARRTAAAAGQPSRSYELRGNANQLLPRRFRARGRSRLLLEHRDNQTFNTNIYDASTQPAQLRRQRGRHLEGLLAQRHFRSDSDVLQRRQRVLHIVGQLAARRRSSANERPLFGRRRCISALAGVRATSHRQTQRAETRLTTAAWAASTSRRRSAFRSSAGRSSR